MQHSRTAAAYLLAPICLLSGCQGASTGRSLGPPDQSTSSAGTSNTTLANEASNDAAAPVLRSSDDSAREALVGTWVLQQVQIDNDSPRSARPGQTTLSIQGGILFTIDACSQQMQAQVTVNQSTLKLTGGIFGGGGIPGSPGHPCGDPEAVDFWNNSTTFEWKVVQSRLVVRSESMTLMYGMG